MAKDGYTRIFSPGEKPPAHESLEAALVAIRPQFSGPPFRLKTKDDLPTDRREGGRLIKNYHQFLYSHDDGALVVVRHTEYDAQGVELRRDNRLCILDPNGPYVRNTSALLPGFEIVPNGPSARYITQNARDKFTDPGFVYWVPRQLRFLLVGDANTSAELLTAEKLNLFRIALLMRREKQKRQPVPNGGEIIVDKASDARFTMDSFQLLEHLCLALKILCEEEEIEFTSQMKAYLAAQSISVE